MTRVVSSSRNCVVTLVVVLAALLTASVLSSSPAHAYTYDRAKAVAYAKKYSCNAGNCRNPAYMSFSSTDCANFVSQALTAGGQTQWGSAYTWRWYYVNSGNRSTSWSVVDWFVRFWVDQSHRATLKSVSMGSAYTAASGGDVYLYDWGKGNGYSHMSMSTGFGKYGSYYDAHAKKNYTQITGGTGDKMAQHTTDRDGAPWNWGYQTETDPKVRKKMRTVIIHMKASG